MRLALFSFPLTSCHCDFKTGTLGHNFKGILYSVLLRTLSIPPAWRIQTQYTAKTNLPLSLPLCHQLASTDHPEEDSTTPDKGVCVPETRKLLSVGSSKGSPTARMNPQALPDLVLYKAWHWLRPLSSRLGHYHQAHRANKPQAALALALPGFETVPSAGPQI